MNFLVVYGAVEDQTQKAADFAGSKLESMGHDFNLLNSSRGPHALDIPSFDAVIIVGLVHQGNHQESVVEFTTMHREELQRLPTLLISISLSIAFEDGKPAAEGYVEKFIEYTRFSPTDYLMVADELHSDHLEYFVEHINELVEFEDHGTVTGKRDFTDWTQLDSDIEKFANTVAAPIAGQENLVDPSLLRISDPLYDQFSAASITSAGQESIGLCYGENILISTSSIFEVCLTNNTSFIPVNLPDWLSLDCKSGDLTGTVPPEKESSLPMACIVYAVDDDGKSAKIDLILEGYEAKSATDTASHIQEFVEGSSVVAGMANMFVDAGIIVEGLEFTATGLPAGLSIDRHSGTVSGTIKRGSARENPYEVMVTVAEGELDGNGISQQVLFEVKEVEAGTPVLA